MADNKYCNLVPANLISAEYTKINDGFASVETDVLAVNAKADGIDDRVDTLITTPISGEAAAQELIDARGGKATLGDRFGGIDSQLVDVATQINDLEADKADKIYVDAGLSLKRDKSILITTNDIDKSVDANKIHLLDLAEEVQSAMAGTSPVISSVADGSITTTKYADGSIIASKLHEEILSRVPYLQSTDSANSAVNVGSYLCINALDMPEATGTFVLTVEKAKTVAGNGQYWFVQTATKEATAHKQYRRFGYYSGSVFTLRPWIECLDVNSNLDATRLADKSITRQKLNDDFMINYAFIPNTGDVNNTITQGNYIVIAGASNTPLANKTFTLKVELFKTGSGSSYWLTQTATTADGTPRSFIRKLYQGQSFSAWVELTTRQNYEFEGKTIVCFGDSITENGDYPERLASKLGANVISIGFGGCRMTTYGVSSPYSELCMARLSNTIKTGDFTVFDAAILDLKNNFSDDNTAQATRLKAIDFNTVDYITIFHGTNDYGGNMPIGTDTDNDETTFKGAINMVVNNILSTYPHIKILFISPFWRATYTGVVEPVDSDTYANPLGNLLIDYVDALTERVHAHHLPVLDLYRESGINKYNYTYYLADGLHPKQDIGYEYVAQKITAGFKSKFNI